MSDSERDSVVSFGDISNPDSNIGSMQSLSDGPSNAQVKTVIHTLNEMSDDLLPKYKYPDEEASLKQKLIGPLAELVRNSETKDNETVKWSDLGQIFDTATLAALDNGFVFTDGTAKMWLYSKGIVEGSSLWKGCQDYRRWLKKDRHCLTQDADVKLSTAQRDSLRFHPHQRSQVGF